MGSHYQSFSTTESCPAGLLNRESRDTIGETADCAEDGLDSIGSCALLGFLWHSGLRLRTPIKPGHPAAPLIGASVALQVGLERGQAVGELAHQVGVRGRPAPARP